MLGKIPCVFPVWKNKHPNPLFSLCCGNPGFISRPRASCVCGHYRVIYYHLGRAYTVHDVHTNIYVRIRYTGNTAVILGHKKWNMDVFDVFDNIVLLIGAKIICNGAFSLPDSDSYSDSYIVSYEVNKGSTGTDSDGDSYRDPYGQLL